MVSALKNMWAILMANPIILVVAGVAALITAFSLLDKSINTVSDNTKRLKELKSNVDIFISGATQTLVDVNKQILDIAAGKIDKETVITQITDQLVLAKKAAEEASQALAIATLQRNASDEGNSPTFTNPITGSPVKLFGTEAEQQRADEAIKKVRELEGALKAVTIAAIGANKQFQASQGIGVNSINQLNKEIAELQNKINSSSIDKSNFAKWGEELRDLNKRLEEAKKLLEPIRNAVNVDAITPQQAPSLLTQPGASQQSVDLTPMQNNLNTLKGVSDEIARIQSELNNVEFGTDKFSEMTAEIRRLNVELEKMQNWGNAIPDMMKSIKDGMRNAAVQGVSTLADELGRAIVNGGGAGDAMKHFVEELIIQVPKLIGMAMLTAAVSPDQSMPWPMRLGLAAGGAILVGASAAAAQSFANNTPDIGSPSATANAQISSDLGTFNSDNAGMPNVHVYMDGREISNIVKNRIDIERELQIGG
jgi:FtsZ-binding cell division protein ZapB